MRSVKSGLAVFVAVAVLLALCFRNSVSAQDFHRSVGDNRTIDGMIDAGTMISVRTNETINTNYSDGRVFSGVVEQDVRNRSGAIAIPRGSGAELIVRKLSDEEVALDLDSVTIGGQRYGIQTNENVVSSEQNQGLGKNKRTAEFLGGGALLGAIIGAISGGGKGAAIGAGVGAAAGAGAQILTRGRNVDVPAESLLTFQLAQPLRPGAVDNGYMRDGVHYHSGYDTGQQRRDYPTNARGNIIIGKDKNITWEGPENSSVYVQVDYEAPKLFAAGRSGVQSASWIMPGHLYVFSLRDANGNEIARDQQDLRPSGRR